MDYKDGALTVALPKGHLEAYLCEILSGENIYQVPWSELFTEGIHEIAPNSGRNGTSPALRVAKMRPQDVPQRISPYGYGAERCGFKTLDVGVTGRDILKDFLDVDFDNGFQSEEKFHEALRSKGITLVCDLEYRPSFIVLAGYHENGEFGNKTWTDENPLQVATEYPYLAYRFIKSRVTRRPLHVHIITGPRIDSRFLSVGKAEERKALAMVSRENSSRENRDHVMIYTTDGATEAHAGLFDSYIIDVTETGSSISRYNLNPPIEVIDRSTPVLIARTEVCENACYGEFIERLGGFLREKTIAERKKHPEMFESAFERDFPDLVADWRNRNKTADESAEEHSCAAVA